MISCKTHSDCTSFKTKNLNEGTQLNEFTYI